MDAMDLEQWENEAGILLALIGARAEMLSPADRKRMLALIVRVLDESLGESDDASPREIRL